MILYWHLKRVLRQYSGVVAAAFEDCVHAAAIGIDLAAQRYSMVNGAPTGLVTNVQHALGDVGVLPDTVIVKAQVQGFLGVQIDVDILTRLQAREEVFAQGIQKRAGLCGKVPSAHA